MGYGIKLRRGGSFKAYIAIQANPNLTVTIESDRASYTATTDSNGIARVEVRRKGAYTVRTSAASGTVVVSKNGVTYPVNIVAVSQLNSITASTYASNTVAVYWTNPSPYRTGILVRYATGDYPTLSSGTLLYQGNGNSITISAGNVVNGVTLAGLTAGTVYYFSAWTYYIVNNTTYYSEVRRASYTAVNYIGTVVSITSPQTWTVPTGWRSVDVFCVGGGAGGGGGFNSNTNNEYGGGAGGGGYTSTVRNSAVVPGQQIPVVIGAGGAGGARYSASSEDDEGPAGNGAYGGATSFGSICSANGGAPGIGGAGSYGAGNGGAGGSGGGGGGTSNGATGGAGGTNGANGVNGDTSSWQGRGGAGQGSTTTAFGENVGTAYSAGGTGYGGAAGADNTGNGGGGGYYSAGGAGGSGLVLVRCAA